MQSMSSTTVTRRGFVALAALGGAGLTLGACSSGDGEDAAEATTAGTAAPDDSAVVVLDEIAALSVLSLGVRPQSVDATFGYASVADICESLDVPVLPGDRSVEEVAADEPSAVIGVSIPTFAEAAADFGRLAPTVVVDFAATWQEQTGQIADALGLTDRATELEAAVQGSIDALARDVEAAGATGTTVSVLLGGGAGTFAAISRTGLVGQLLTEVGLARPAAQDVDTEGTAPFVEFSAERLLDHDADLVLVIAGPAYPTGELTGSPLWGQLSAVQADRVTDVFAEVWFAASAFSVDWIVQDIRAVVLGEGDVATGDEAVARWQAFDGS